ncbi:segregation and condensation protein A [Anaerocolumna sp. MB42-C2]|uniref:segregation and condensation protein A n=1 Tax=Anaerocolumna sp. MB42-C2 TaxID=3070997 RepID=UPI0027DFB958|nr:segregation/condensation protein A [Anaerocolumna sp. MB42-C2]WMJ88106.1 segregation/condensation protein A [Anaerocolumna sp. MB42-C2]
MSISVKLDVFEGPLDLLLHLIDKNKVNIHDIPIAIITEQYMEYIRQMKTKNLDIMSEFLVMAATLINIKSKMLLPKDETKEEEEEDPRQELVERLLEYKMYKYISLDLKDREMDAARILYKDATIPKEIEDFKEEIDPRSLLSDLTLAKLHKIFESVIKKQVDKIDPIRSKFGKIEKEEINLTEKILDIQKYGLIHKSFSFRGLLMKQSGKMDIIVTFLGVLELIKIGQVRIKQDNLFEDIMITFTGDVITELENDLVLN